VIEAWKCRVVALALVAASLVSITAACSSPKKTVTPEIAPTEQPGAVTTTVPQDQGVVFSAVDGNIDAYLSVAPFTKQRVVAAGTGPEGTTPHGQICFAPDATKRFVIAETRTPRGFPATAGWGIYQLTGDNIDTFRVRRVGGWDSPGDMSVDSPTTYGCTFLSDGRLFTTDVGNQRSGPATGRLVEWFSPFDSAAPTPCVIADALATPLSLSSDASGAVYLASARTPTAGVWRFRGTFPAAVTGCVKATDEPAGEPDPTTTTTETRRNVRPPAEGPTPTMPPGPASVTAKRIIDQGSSGLQTPTGVSVAPSGKALVVTSAADGLIVAFDLFGAQPEVILPASQPPSPVVRNPFAVAITPSGAVIYVDSGPSTIIDSQVIPATNAGSIDQIDTSSSRVRPPITMAEHLNNPDGIGLYLPPSVSGGSASKV